MPIILLSGTKIPRSIVKESKILLTKITFKCGAYKYSTIAPIRRVVRITPDRTHKATLTRLATCGSFGPSKTTLKAREAEAERIATAKANYLRLVVERRAFDAEVNRRRRAEDKAAEKRRKAYAELQFLQRNHLFKRWEAEDASLFPRLLKSGRSPESMIAREAFAAWCTIREAHRHRLDSDAESGC